MKIIQATEPMAVAAITAMIYGQPGAGKTSLSCTSSNALLIDCDKGAHRSQYRAATLSVSKWEDVSQIIDPSNKAALDGYDTIVVDTIDKLLDMITDYIGRAEVSELGAKYSGSLFDRKRMALTLQGFGTLKGIFGNFFRRLQAMGKDVILIAHETNEKGNGEEAVKIPKVTGGSLDLLKEACDLVGYLTITGEGRVLTFSPSPLHWGKDGGRIGSVHVPDFAEDSAFMAGLLTKAKDNMTGLAALDQEARDTIKHYKEKLALIKTEADFKALGELMRSETQMVQAQLEPAFKATYSKMKGGING